MIKEIYDFYNGKRCRQETGDVDRCGFMKNGCEKKKLHLSRTQDKMEKRVFVAIAKQPMVEGLSRYL